MPVRDMKNKYSAIVSNLISILAFSDLMEIKENKHENVSNKATKAVNMSMIVVSVWSFT
jgi:hypothetical protein